MITEADFYEIAKSRPEMMRAYYKAVDAIIEVRKEVATNQSGLWATARLRKKQFTATFLLLQFTNGFIFNGQPLSEEDKKLVRNWIEGAATFHMLPEEEKNRQLLRNARDIEEEELLLGGRTSGIITALAPTGLSTRFSRAGFVYVVSTAHVKDFGGFYQTAILKYSSTNWEAGHLANRQFVYRIEVMSQLRSVQEHIDTVKMALSKKEDAWEGTKTYQDDVINAHGRRNYCPQEMSWTDKRIRDIVSAADINYASASEKELGGEISAELLLARGIAFAEKGQFDRAIADYDEAIRLNPQDTNAFYNRGFSYGKKGEWHRDYDEAIRLHVDFANLSPCAAWRTAQRPTRPCIAIMTKRSGSISRIPTHSTTAATRILIEVITTARSLHDRAIADFNEAIRLDPNFTLAIKSRAEAIAKKNELGGSTEELRLRWLEDNDVRLGLEDAVLRLSSGEVRAGNDLRKPVEEARSIRNLLNNLHSRYNRKVIEQAAIAGVLHQRVTGDPVNAAAAAEYIARRLDALTDETERGWKGRFNEDGFKFERTLRGVKEVAVIDRALLGSADARKLDEFAPSLQQIYPRPTPPALLRRKDEETPIHGPVDLFEAVMAVGRKVARQEKPSAEERHRIGDYEVQPKSSVLNNFDFGKFKLDKKLDDLTGLVEFSPAKYAVMMRRFKGEKNYDAPPVNFLGRPWQLMISTVHGQICKIAANISLSNEREATPIATEALQYCKERLGSPSEQETGLFIWDTKDGNVVLHTAEGVEGFLSAIYLTSGAIRKFELV